MIATYGRRCFKNASKEVEWTYPYYLIFLSIIFLNFDFAIVILIIILVLF